MLEFAYAGRVHSSLHPGCCFHLMRYGCSSRMSKRGLKSDLALPVLTALCFPVGFTAEAWFGGLLDSSPN